MGDPRRIRKKYSGPTHPWLKARLEEERALVREYALKNKKELDKANSKIKGFAAQAKHLIALSTEQAKKETKQLIDKLARIGLLAPGAKLDDVLNLQTRDILERRLQTLVYKKGLARTPRQARQFITHNHVLVGENTISVPGYIVRMSEEPNITFRTTSTLTSKDHPERVTITRTEEEEPKKRPAKKQAKRPAKKPAKNEEKKTEKKEEKKESAEKPTEAKK